MALPLKKRGISFVSKAFVTDVLKMAVSAVIMAGAVWGVSCLMNGAGKLAALVLPVGVGVAVYAACVFVLKVPEAKIAVGTARKLLGKGNGNDA